jgi:hypothetical protein
VFISRVWHELFGEVDRGNKVQPGGLVDVFFIQICDFHGCRKKRNLLLLPFGMIHTAG